MRNINISRGRRDARCCGAGRTNVRGRLWFAVVLVIGELRVFRGLLARCDLCGDGRGVAFVHGSDFRRARLDIDAAVTSVVADAVGGLCAVVDVVHDDCTVVGVVVDAGADVGDGTVVVEVIALPVAAEEAEANVSEAVVDAAVEADVGAPIAAVEAVMHAAPAPVGWGPESAVVGGRNPFTGDPVVAVVAPGPVTGRPEVVRIRSWRLVVFGKQWWGLVGGDSGFSICAVGIALVIAVVVGVVVVGDRRALLLRNGFTLLLRLVGVALAEDSASLAGRAGGEVAHGRVGAIGVSCGVVGWGGVAAIAAS